jgi:glycosyltransferase involved in cell wall biosynthesis
MASNTKAPQQAKLPDPAQGTAYVILTPARNEDQIIEKTLRSVINQTIRPAQWIIVDDGSTDETSAILDRFSSEFPWISALHRKDRGFCDEYVGTVETIMAGYPSLSVKNWEFLAFLDADIELGHDYFERCFEEFRKDPKLGIGGGVLCELNRDVAKVQHALSHHVPGATKIYRRECWDAIGLTAIPGYDTYDEIKANYLGWRTRSFLNIQAFHLRPHGASWGSWRDAVKNGHMDYFLGYHPLFMIFKCLRRLVAKPYVLNSVGHLWGYLRGYLKRRPQLADRALIGYLRRQQLRRMHLPHTLLGKERE